MSIEQLIQTMNDARAAQEQEAAPLSLHARLTQLAAANRSTKAALVEALQIIARSYGSPYACAYLTDQSESYDEEVHFGATDPGFWRENVQQYQAETIAAGNARARLLGAKNAALKVALLSAPLPDAGRETSGAITIVVESDGTALREQLTEFESACALTAFLLFGPRATASQNPTTSRDDTLNAMGRASGVSSPVELAFSITNNLRNKLGCEQVSLGLVKRGEIRILSISGLDDVKKRSPGVIDLQSAMSECYDFRDVLVCQADDEWADARLTTGHLLHRQWHQQSGGASVASIPLRFEGRVTAVLSVRNAPGDLFTEDRLATIRKLVEPFAASLAMVERAHRSVIEHSRDTLHNASESLMAPGRFGRKILAATFVLAAIWFFFFQADYHVRVPAKIVADGARNIAMPFDGQIAAVDRSVGDIVHVGDVICQLDTRDLELSREELVAQAAVYAQRRLSALAADKPVDARIAGANEDLLRARIDILDRKIARATIRATIDGMIVEGDLRQMINSTLTQGEPLYRIAPLDQRRLEIRIPDHAIKDVATGLNGRFASAAKPENKQPFRISRVQPTAQIIDSENVYIVEAEAQWDGDWLRPGMDGFAKVEIGRRPVWWIALHNTIDYLRMNFWL